MPHSPLFADLMRLVRLAESSDPREGRASGKPITRRDLLKGIGLTAGAAAIAQPLRARGRVGPIDVGIVGAGLAGLVCADELAKAGIRASVYDAAPRVGGRCASLRDYFPGQVAELGGEFIDNLHKTMIGYARRFGLELEDVAKSPGEIFYYFEGRHVPESVIVQEFRAFVPRMREDLRRLSKAPRADAHNQADIELDHTSLQEYLETRGASTMALAAIREAYIAEFGLAPDRHSCLNFLLFIHADRRSKFTPFGVFSDERWHVRDGNDRIVEGLAAAVAGQIQLGVRLVRVRKDASGRIELAFKQGNRTMTRAHDAVVLTLPFSVLRNVELDGSLGLPSWKRSAIQLLGYGTNAKMMVGFTRRRWVEVGSNGTSYSDQLHHQTTWETNPANAGQSRAILTDYSGAGRGSALDPKKVQSEADLFLQDLERVFPGSRQTAAVDSRGRYLAQLEHWPSNPLSLGSYTCYLPGQFTTIAGNEAKAVGNLFFAGEHTNSFYEWQGFMEGAALSGIEAAKAILAI